MNSSCHGIIDRYFLYVIMKALIRTFFGNEGDSGLYDFDKKDRICLDLRYRNI